jgi:hypothetical protein
MNARRTLALFAVANSGSGEAGSRVHEIRARSSGTEAATARIAGGCAGSVLGAPRTAGSIDSRET